MTLASTAAQWLFVVLFACVAGYYHVQDFERDRELRPKPLGWIISRWQLILYCAVHGFASVVFYFAALPLALREFAESSRTLAFVNSWPIITRPLASLLFYLMLVRSRFWTTWNDGGRFYWGPKEISEILRLVLRRSLLNHKVACEGEDASNARNWLAAQCPSLRDQVEVLRETQRRMRERLSSSLRDHLDAKWSRIENNVANRSDSEALRTFIAMGVDILVLYVANWEHLKTYFADAMTNVSRKQ